MQTRSTVTRGMWLLVAACFVLRAPLFAQDREPNDSTSQAVEITLPHFDLVGNISSTGDVDFYKFTALKGQEITVWARTASSSLTAALGFYNGSGKLLAYNDTQWSLRTNGPGEEPILYLKVPYTGTWYISVSDISRFQSQHLPSPGSTGEYQLILGSSGFDTPAVTDPWEPNDSRSTARNIAIPVETSANLLYFGDIDWYRFTANRAEKVIIDVDALEKTTGFSDFGVKTRIGVFDRYGNLLDESQEGVDPDSGFKGDPALLFQAPYEGNFYLAVTASWDAQYSTGFSNALFLDNPYVSSARHDIGYYRLNVHVQNEQVFPQIANGSFGDVYFTTTLLLVNYSSQTATGSVDLFNSDGTPMMSSLEPGAEPASSCWFSIPPKGSWVVSTDGEGPGASGYAVLRSSIPVGASAVFSQHASNGALMTEAGVVAAPPMEFFTFPVDVTGEFNTGVAIANTDQDRSVNLYLKLLDTGGKVVQTRSVALQAGDQISVFVSGAGQLFPAVTHFRGSLQVFADAPVPAIALRSSAQTLSTLPAASLNEAQTPVTLYFPQVVNGRADSSYRSTIILTNPGYFRVSGTLAFLRSDGSPMPAGGSAESTIPFSIEAQGTRFIDLAPAAAELQRGYAVLRADHTVGGVIIFSQYDNLTGRLQTEVAVQAAALYQRFCVFAEQQDGFTTGIAVANVNPVATDLDYRLDFGEDPALEKGPVSLAPGRQTADMIAGTAQIFPEFSGRGNLEVFSTQPVPAIALRISNTSMTALPVIPVP